MTAEAITRPKVAERRGQLKDRSNHVAPYVRVTDSFGASPSGLVDGELAVVCINDYYWTSPTTRTRSAEPASRILCTLLFGSSHSSQAVLGSCTLANEETLKAIVAMLGYDRPVKQP